MSSSYKGILAGLASGALWGLSFLIPRVFPHISPGELAFARFVGFAVPSLMLLLRHRQLSLFWGPHFPTSILFGIIGYSLYYFTLIYAVRWCGISVSSLIVGLIPLTVGIAGRHAVIRKNYFRFALMLIAFGILSLNLEGLKVAVSRQFYLGVALSFVCLALWTGFAVANASFLKAHPEVKGSEWASATGLASLLTVIPFTLAEGFWRHGNIDLLALHSRAGLFEFVLASVILGFGGSFVATILWNFASQTLPVGLVGQLIVSETVFALLYGCLYDGKLPSPIDALSMAFIIGGVLCGIKSFQSGQSQRRD